MTASAGPTSDPAFEDAPCGLLVTGTDDVVVRVNATFLGWTGYERDQVIGRPFQAFLHPGSQAFYGTQVLDELWSSTELRGVALRLTRADASVMPILANASMIGAPGEPTGMRLAVFDASSREDLERELILARAMAESSVGNVRVLQEAATRFLVPLDEVDFAAVLAEVARTAFAASDVAVVTYRDGGKQFDVLAGGHLRPLLDAVRATRPAPVALPVDEIITVSDLDEAFGRSKEVGERFREARAAAFSTVAIPEDGESLGAFVCLYGRPRTFDAATLGLHRALAEQAGLAFARIRGLARLRAAASLDQLTGLANRTAIDEHADSVFAGAREAGEPMSLIFLDLDGFKAINDTYGHRAGDLVLREVGARLRQAVRATDVVGRFGGDEFLIVCRGADETDAHAIAERVAAAIREPIEGLPAEALVTASIGIATVDPLRTTETTAEAVTRRADAAMYRSKRAGRDRIAVAVAVDAAIDAALGG